MDQKQIFYFKRTIKRNLPGFYNFFRICKDRIFLLKVIIGKKIFHNTKKLMINIGGGKWYKNYWRVLDFQGEIYRFNRHFLDYDYNLASKQKMPLRDNSVDMFYSEHTFEHIDDQSVRYAFSEIFRALKTGGAFRIVVPDMDLIYQKFLERDEDFFRYKLDDYEYCNISITKALFILFAYPEVENLNEKEVRDKFESFTKKDFFDFYSKPLRQNLETADRHINWFNYFKMEKFLREVGFKCIYKSDSQQSRIREMKGKGFDTRPLWSLHVEAIKN